MLRGEQGQAIVEAAFVLPAIVFLLLLAIQLTQLQRARLLADSAALAAARAGIVMNGDPERMREAAMLGLLPSVGRTDSVAAAARTLARFKADTRLMEPFGLELVRVDVRSPMSADFGAWGQHLHGQEIDFDDVRPGATEATLLSLQLRYLYELRVPFANRVLQTLWMAATVARIPLAPLEAAARLGRYYLPVQAFCTMRMQSNPYRKWARP